MRCSILTNLGSEPLKEFLANLQRSFDILFSNRFVGMMADVLQDCGGRASRWASRAAIIMASWPAPLGIALTGKPAASMASLMKAVRRSSIGTAGSIHLAGPLQT